MPRHYKKSFPAVDWALLKKLFPTHAEHITRVRKNPEKLARLSQRLISEQTVLLRAVRDGKETITNQFKKGFVARRTASERGKVKKG